MLADLVDENDLGGAAVLRALGRQDAHRPGSIVQFRLINPLMSKTRKAINEQTSFHSHPAPQMATASPSATSPISVACQAVERTSERSSTSRSGSSEGTLRRLSSAVGWVVAWVWVLVI